jgi:hypothetical protein
MSISSQAVVVHTFNPSTWEAEAGRFLSSRSALSTEWVSRKPCLGKPKKKKKKSISLTKSDFPQDVFKKITNTPKHWRNSGEYSGAANKNATAGHGVTGMDATELGVQLLSLFLFCRLGWPDAGCVTQTQGSPFTSAPQVLVPPYPAVAV